MASRAPSLMIMTGEVSGDMHAAGLVRALKRRVPGLTCFGIGGDELRAAGMETLHDISGMAVTGFSEALRRLPYFRRIFFEMLDVAKQRRPDAVILVDYPGFNVRFAERARGLGLRTIYYICPQVWAWNRARVPRIARAVNRLISIFPFEAPYFDGTGLRVDFAGNPLVDETRHEREASPVTLPWGGAPRVALLPGSRDHEIDRILPALWGAAELIEKRHPGAGFLLAAPSPRVEAHLRARISALGGGPARWQIVTGQTRQVMRQATAGLIASGTATLEAALMRCPTVIAYRVAPLTALLGRMLMRVKYLGIANIVAGREVCPERLQSRCTPSELAEAIDPLLTATPQRAAMLAAFDEVAGALGAGGAEERAADSVLEEIGLR